MLKGKPKGFTDGSGVLCGVKERKSDLGALGFSSHGGEVRWRTPKSSRLLGITSLMLDMLIHIQVEMFRRKESELEIQMWKCQYCREEVNLGDRRLPGRESRGLSQPHISYGQCGSGHSLL